ncbi:MAG: hypothetical protein JRE40_00585 [Deltaproteobacteria bacterium]|nr:hypothetical protein [Deltaproteobacteria bacterium]MBW2673180.1 hypothetical protein [Deltaproteobacteria bacterium]
MSYDIQCRYFEKAGRENTRDVLETSSQRARQLGISTVLVATCSGKTAMEAIDHLGPDIQIIAVTHYTGFVRPDHQEMKEETRRTLEAKEVRILTCQHAFGGVGRGIRMALKTYQVEELMAYTLRMFGQGTKVAVELALMAADAGLVRTDEDIISIGGTATGADTALLLRPANASEIFNLKVKEIICKPATF